MRVTRLLTSLLFVAASSCSSDDSGGAAAQGPSFHYPLDGTLRLNHLQAKGTHNSYHLESKGNTQPEWMYSMPTLTDQLVRDGVRHVELDLHRMADDEPLEVHHIGLLDPGTTCKLFTDCLKELRAFSDARPAHHALYVQMEIKGGVNDGNAEAFFTQLHAEILSVWPRARVLAPDDVKGSFPTIREALATRGWPTLGETRQKIFFAFNESGVLRDLYTHGKKDLDGRLVFVESSPQDPWGAIAIENDPVGDASAIDAALAANMLVRTFGTALGDDPSRNAAALASGAHFVSTDFPADAPDPTKKLVVPGGTPSRCNPKIAPAECTSTAIEDPAFVK